MKNYYFFLFICFSFNLKAQFQLPEFSYDDVEIITEENSVLKKVYKKDKQLKLEINYPKQRVIKTFCGETKSKYDSVYIFFDKKNTQITFDSYGTIVKSWVENKPLIEIEDYRFDKTLSRKYKILSFLDDINEGDMEAFPICKGYKNVYLEDLKYDKKGKEQYYRDYKTGRFRNNGIESRNDKYLILKQKADSILSSYYGLKFFQQHIIIDFNETDIYYYKNRFDGGNERRIVNRWWYEETEPNKEDLAIDFAYKFLLNKRAFSFINIRIDLNGELILDRKKHQIYKSGTKGLLAIPNKKDFLPANQLEDFIIQKNFPKEYLGKYILNWKLVNKNKSRYSNRGTLFYQVLFNKTSKSTYDCHIDYYDEWLINPFTKEINKEGEEKIAACRLTHVQRKLQNQKYGFLNYLDNDLIIPCEYDKLPRYLDFFMIAKKNEQYGGINHKNEVIIPFENDLIEFVKFEKERLAESFIIIKKNNLYGLYDTKGIELLPIEYDKLEKETEYSLTGFKKGQPKIIFDFKSNVKAKYKKKK